MQPVKEFTRKHYGQLVFDIGATADDMMQVQRCKAMPERGMYEQQTRQIRVVVKPFYLEDQSSPDENHFVWAYHVKIENIGRETVQLRNRYWRITDAYGRVQEVRGPGVVGEQPILHPGEHFEYTSGTPLQTPSGIMVGTYQMESATGECFDVAIPAFSLDSPHQPIQLN